MASIRTSGSAGLPALLLALLLALPLAAADARLKLLMFDADDCPYCEQWHDEVGGIYAKTAEGRRAPLETTPLYGPLPAALRLREPVRYTPTFVLLDGDGQELGRIIGYPGEDHFWGLLGELLERVPEP